METARAQAIGVRGYALVLPRTSSRGRSSRIELPIPERGQEATKVRIDNGVFEVGDVETGVKYLSPGDKETTLLPGQTVRTKYGTEYTVKIMT